MASYQRNYTQSSIPEPEYDNLEVRCTWIAEYEEVSNIRITLEVKCVPNTQLQLLDLQRPGVFFEDSFLEPFLQIELDTDNETDTPQSPLFGFSPLLRDDRKNEVTLAASKTPQSVARAPSTEPAPRSPVSSVPYASLPPSSPESEIGGLTKSRKRSATDADFPDSGSDGDNELDEPLKDVTNRKARQLNSVGPTGIGDRSTEKMTSDLAGHREITCPGGPRKPKSTKIPSLIDPNENVGLRSPSKASTTERARAPGHSVLKGKQPQKSSLIPKPTSTGHSETLVSTSSSTETAVKFHPLNKAAPGSNAATADGTKVKLTRETRVRFQLPCDAMTETDSSGGQPLSPRPSKKLGAELEQRRIETSGISDETKSSYAPENLGEPSHHCERIDVEQPKLSDQPEVKIIDGLIMLKNSERVRPATFKVTVIAAVFVMLPSDNGWSYLEIPGIPRTGGSKVGVLLFLMPNDYGLEIRTTNLNRATIVENCLIAEFINTGNLVIPLRRCGKESCGNISDFTVDQEIVSHSVVKTAATSSRSDKPVIEMRCHALCSVRLYNRCFWSERCIIRLHVDGGPQGFFECDVTPQKQAMKKIFIVAKENTPMGVSHIKVTCSPKDMDRLYVRWAMEFPGYRAAYWVPRIYSTSSRSHEHHQDGLRYALLEVLNGPLYLCSGAEATEVEYDRDGELTESYKHIEILTEDATEDLKRMHSPPIPEWSILSRIKRATQLLLTRYYQNPNHFLKQVLIGVVCLTFLPVGFFMSVSSHHNFRQSLSSLLQAPQRVPEHKSQTPWFPPEKLLMSNQDGVEDQESSNIGLNVLDMMNRYEVVNSNTEETKDSVGNEKEQSKQTVNLEPGVDEHEETQVSVRDRIDYWLGWTGPI